MTNQSIDNSIGLDDVILWQYQHAEKLKAMVEFYRQFYADNVTSFYDDWREKIFNVEIDDNPSPEDLILNKFALALWGAVLGYSRPSYKDANNIEIPVSDNTYRNLLKARFRVMRSNASLTAILQYVKDAFDNQVLVTDTADMALHYNLKLNHTLSQDIQGVIVQNPDSVFVYPAGVKTNERVNEVVFGFSGQNLGKTASEPTVGGFADSTFANNWSVISSSWK